MKRLVRVQDLTPRGDVKPRLSVVSELGPAWKTVTDGFAPFLPDAAAPNGKWRAPTSAELSTLVGERGSYDDSDIFLVALPGLARSLGEYLQNRESLTSLNSAVRHIAFIEAIAGCIDELIPFCTRPDALMCQGAWVNSGGMQLVTHNMQILPHRRIGLHVDDWDHLPLIERARGRRRLCANLGLAERYLLFLTTPLSSLVAAGEFPKEIPEHLSPAVIVRSYLQRFPNQTTVRLRVDPGEAYIMNADDIIHDGASSTPNIPDVALHFLGFFGPEEL